MRKLSIAFFVILLTCFSSAEPINDTIACIKAYIDSFQKDLDPTIFRIFKSAFPNTL